MCGSPRGRLLEALRKQTAHRRDCAPAALRRWPRIAAAGPRAPLPDVDEIAAPPEGNGVADSQVLAHGPRPLVCV